MAAETNFQDSVGLREGESFEFVLLNAGFYSSGSPPKFACDGSRRLQEFFTWLDRVIGLLFVYPLY